MTRTITHSQSGLAFQMADLTLSERDYKQIKDLVFRHSSIDLGDNKKELVVCRLGKRIRKLGLRNFPEYLRLLEGPQGEEEILNLVDAISTNHTFFFREIQHFEHVFKVALPYWFKERGQTPVKIWSAACSTGEEPYSIAITAEEFARQNQQFSYTLDCTDISRIVLDKASKGIYSHDRVRTTPSFAIPRYFLKNNAKPEPCYQVKPALKRNISFQRINLLQFPYRQRTQYHIIFLRNVIMYFNKETQEQLINQLCQHLQPGGFLMIGHAENLNGLKHPLKQIQPAIFRLLD